jgi:hypothetical protein
MGVMKVTNDDKWAVFIVILVLLGLMSIGIMLYKAQS